MGDILDVIAQARADPELFQGEGRYYEIVKCIFQGEPDEEVRALLTSNNLYLARIGVEVAEELGSDGYHFIDDVRDLYFDKLCSSDLSFKYDALELMAANSMHIDATHFRLFVAALGDEDIVIVRLALRLLSCISYEYIAHLSGMLMHQRDDLNVYLNLWDSNKASTDDIDEIKNRITDSTDSRSKMVMVVAVARMMMHAGESRKVMSKFVEECTS